MPSGTICKTLPGNKRRKIDFRGAETIRLLADEYKVLVSLLPPKPSLHINGDLIVITPLPIRVLSCILKKDGRVCTYSELIGQVWGIRVEVLNQDGFTSHKDRVEKAVETLKGASGDLKQNIQNERGQGYSAKGLLKKYCILEKASA